ncbi:hypothetical protein KY5_6725 [Streptomyces formicae]|uniref:Uncharacterized protein n=1 Tax=Streptomyces formicae TaxID=1616117 RepID=A0A291QJW3_9ACTN|nr:hypothetical protein KY5_6725 [Streptomyces formicae]
MSRVELFRSRVWWGFSGAAGCVCVGGESGCGVVRRGAARVAVAVVRAGVGA